MSKLEEHPEDTIQSRPISSTSNVHHDEKKVIYEGTTASVSPEQTSTLGEKNEDIEAHTPASGHSPRSPSPNIATTAERHEYLGPLALTALTLGICMSVFLLSLDRTIITTVGALRTTSCLMIYSNVAVRLFPISPINSILMMMWVGMVVHIWSPHVLSNRSMVVSSLFSISNGLSSAPWPFSSWAVLYVASHQTR